MGNATPVHTPQPPPRVAMPPLFAVAAVAPPANSFACLAARVAHRAHETRVRRLARLLEACKP